MECFVYVRWNATVLYKKCLIEYRLGRDSRGSGVATERREGARGRGESCIHTDTNSNLKGCQEEYSATAYTRLSLLIYSTPLVMLYGVF